MRPKNKPWTRGPYITQAPPGEFLGPGFPQAWVAVSSWAHAEVSTGHRGRPCPTGRPVPGWPGLVPWAWADMQPLVRPAPAAGP